MDAIHWMDKHIYKITKYSAPIWIIKHKDGGGGGGRGEQPSWQLITPEARSETPNLSPSPIWRDTQKEQAAKKEPHNNVLSPILAPSLPQSNKWTIFQYPTATGIKIRWFPSS